MKESIEIITCDLCGSKVDGIVNVSYPVLFMTDQNEGRSCVPYIEEKKLDLCPECLEKSCRITAQGAQGYNIYFMRKEA